MAEAGFEGMIAHLRDKIATNHGRVLTLFNEWDLSRDGQVGKKELRRALMKMGYDPSEAELNSLYDTFDQDGSGYIQYDELYSALKKGISAQPFDRRPDAQEAKPGPGPEPVLGTSLRTLLHMSSLVAGKALPTPEEQRVRVKATIPAIEASLSRAVREVFHASMEPGMPTSEPEMRQYIARTLNPELNTEVCRLLARVASSGELHVADLMEVARTPQIARLTGASSFTPPEKVFTLSSFGGGADAYVEAAVGSVGTVVAEDGTEVESRPHSWMLESVDEPEEQAKTLDADGSAELFTDPHFPPVASSLVASGDFTDRPRWSSFKWVRASTMRASQGRPLSLFGTTTDEETAGASQISPNDVHQGELGDCYFLAALSALAEQPDRIRRLFHSSEVSPRGRYAVRMYKQATPVNVVVDDHFPVHAHAVAKVDEFGNAREGEFVGSGQPAFSDSPSGELWVLLLEKAWAKLHSSYSRIESGRTAQAFSDLTGAPHYVVQWRSEGRELGTGELDVEEAWTQLAGAVAQGLPASASMPEVGTHDMQREYGLVEGHAYSMLDAREMRDGALRLVKLRNPWGNGTEWKGEWSDGSPLWTEEMKAELGYSAAADGVFWMAFGDFVQTFNSFSWVHLADGWVTTRTEPFVLDGGVLRGHAVMMVRVETRTRAVVTMHLPDKRSYSDKYANEQYGGCRLEVVQLSPIARHVASTEPCRQRDVSTMPLDLDAGEYMVIAWCTFPNGVRRRCVASVYAERAVALSSPSEVESLTPERVHEALADAHLELVRRTGTPMDFGSDVAMAGVRVSSAQHAGGFVLLVDNSGGVGGKMASVAAEFSLRNASLLPPDADRAPKIKTSIHAGETRLIRVRPDRVGEAFSYGQSMSVQIARDFQSKGIVAQLRDETKQSGSAQDFGASGAPQIRMYTYQFESGIGMLFENGEQSKSLELQLQFSLGNLRITPPRESDNEVTIQLSPGQSDFLLLRKIDTTGGWSFGYSTRSMVRSA